MIISQIRRIINKNVNWRKKKREKKMLTIKPSAVSPPYRSFLLQTPKIPKPDFVVPALVALAGRGGGCSGTAAPALETAFLLCEGDRIGGGVGSNPEEEEDDNEDEGFEGGLGTPSAVDFT